MSDWRAWLIQLYQTSGRISRGLWPSLAKLLMRMAACGIPGGTLTRGRLLVKILGHDDMLSADSFALWSSLAWVGRGLEG